jgi:hypothetical protein
MVLSQAELRLDAPPVIEVKPRLVRKGMVANFVSGRRDHLE